MVTYTGDLIPSGTSGYAHYWLKMVLSETSNNGTQATINIKIYFCRDAQTGDGYHYNTGNFLKISVGGTQIASTSNTGSIQVNGGAASETLIYSTDYNVAVGWNGTISATFSQTQNTKWSGTVSGTFTTSTVGNVYVYNGSAWVKGIPWGYTSSGWKKASTGKVSVYNGSAWKQ